MARAAIALAVMLAAQQTYAADNYPQRPIRIVAPNTAGSGLDTMARLISSRLTSAWGVQVIVDNRPGAGGAIGTEIAARAAPDGYTLLMIVAPHP